MQVKPSKRQARSCGGGGGGGASSGESSDCEDSKADSEDEEKAGAAGPSLSISIGEPTRRKLVAIPHSVGALGYAS